MDHGKFNFSSAATMCTSAASFRLHIPILGNAYYGADC